MRQNLELWTTKHMPQTHFKEIKHTFLTQLKDNTRNQLKMTFVRINISPKKSETFENTKRATGSGFLLKTCAEELLPVWVSVFQNCHPSTFIVQAPDDAIFVITNTDNDNSGFSLKVEMFAQCYINHNLSEKTCLKIYQLWITCIV